jgi:hypothetical protein
MDSLRTTSLFHYPQKLDTLKEILVQGFKPNYCKENFSYSDKTDLIVGIPMVSFCDIPLTRITNFKKRYKEYAIGLSKEWGLRNGINPVLYATPNSFVLNSLQVVDDMRWKKDEFLKERMRTTGKPLETNNQNYTAIPVKMNDPEFENIFNSFMDNVHLFQVRSTLFGYTKTYLETRKDKKQINYEENEWRFVLGENKLSHIDWLWGVDSFSTWRGDEKKPKPESKFQPLKFAVEDVNFIILSDDTQISKMIKFIEGLNEFGGNKIPNKSQKSILISKIISMDRIEKDF